MKKIYYQLSFTQTSPLRIGSTDSERTDTDLMLDGRGMPFIPGSSIAGVLRSMVSEEEANRIFGMIKGDKLENSHLIISDAILTESADTLITKRDGIGLNEWGVTKKGSKFDYEVSECKAPFVSVVEWNGTEESEIKECVEPLLKRLVTTGISFGSRTTRGYGKMILSVKKKEFCYPDQLEEWLNFTPLVPGAFDNCDPLQGSEVIDEHMFRIEAEIAIDGSFSVSKPTSKAEPIENGNSPDKIVLRNIHGLPVITGTAWAGTFRHHMLDLCRTLGIEESKVNSIFGLKNPDDNEYIRSKIRFEETAIKGGKAVVLTRNAVDRFTGSPRNKALFTSEVSYGGTGKLVISLEESNTSQIVKQLLMATICDLHMGLVTVGGENGVGRGRAHIKKLFINGQDKTSDLGLSCKDVNDGSSFHLGGLI